MSVKNLCSAVLLLAAVSSPFHAAAETVFLKDGAFFEGSVVGDSADAVTVRTAEKKLSRLKE